MSPGGGGGRPPLPKLTLTRDERTTLKLLARGSNTSHATRAAIILCCAAGETLPDVATRFKVSRAKVWRWRERFRTRRLTGGLQDERRSGRRPRLTDDDVVARVQQTIAAAPPRNAAEWSRRALAKAVGLSPSSAGRVLRDYRVRRRRRLIVDASLTARGLTRHSVDLESVRRRRQ